MARGFGSGGIYADPAFQMGMALGNAYGNLWASNAENRNREQMRELIRNQTGQMNDNEIAQIAAMGDTQGVNPGAFNGVEQAGASAAAQQDPAAAYRQRLFVAGNATPQQQAAGVTGNIPGSYVAGAANSTDEALNRIQQQDQLRRAGAATRNPLFSADDIAFAAQMAGIHEDVIEDFMPTLQKAAANNARETLLPDILNDSYGYTDGSGEYVPPNHREALEGILELGRYDPETAKTLMSGAISSKDLYNAQREEIARLAGLDTYAQKLQIADAIKQQQEEREFNRTVEALMQSGMSREQAEHTARLNYSYGTGRRSGSRGSAKSLLSSEDFKYANETLAAYDEKIAMANGDLNALTPEEQADYNRLSAYKEYALNQTYGTPTSSGNTDLIAMANAALAQGATEQQLLDELKNQRGYGENTAEYQLVAEYLKGRRSDNTRPQRRQQQEEPQQHERASESGLFDFDLPSFSPASPLLQTDENGKPRWVNDAEKRGLWAVLAEAGDMNRGTNGLPYFWKNNG